MPVSGMVIQPTQSGFSADKADRSCRGGAVVSETTSAGSLEFSGDELLSEEAVDSGAGVLSSTYSWERVSKAVRCSLASMK